MGDFSHYPPADASGLIAKAEREAAQAQQQQREELQQQLREGAADGAPPPTADGALPFPPGFVGALAQYVYQQAPRPVAEVSVVAALGLMAGMAGREWHISNTGLNLYIVLVAKSGIGKEAMHTGIWNLVTAALRKRPEVGWVVDFNDYVSGPALTKGCAQNPCFVNVADEIGHKFLAMAADRDPSMRSLRKQLTTLYSKSGPGSIAGGISYSSQDNNVEAVQAVAYSLIGETTPRNFYESITDAMMADGFMSRFCVIEYTGGRPAKNPFHGCAPPQPVVDHIAQIVEHSMRLRAGDKFCPVAVSADAQALLDRYEGECDAAINATDDENLRQLWNRAHLKVLRIAALLAVGDNPYAPSVSLEQAAWAVDLVRHGIGTFDRRIRTGEVGEGSDGGREQKVLELCREFLTLPAGHKKLLEQKGGEKMQQVGIVPRRFLQQRTQRLAAFEKHPLKHTKALDLTLKTAIANGYLMEVKKNPLVEEFGFHGEAYRVVSLP